MSSILMETNDLKNTLDLLILEKTNQAKRLASGIKRLTNSRERLNGHIRIPTDMYRSIANIVPIVIHEK
jgi:hypothetical protein